MPVDHHAADHSGDKGSHPYDDPWKIMRDLRSQVQDLRAALMAEQQQRAAEVLELRHEVTALKKDLTKGVTELKNSNTTMASEMLTQRSKLDKTLDEFKSQNKQTINQLNTLLQDEIRDRKHSQHMQSVKLQALEEDVKQDHEIVQRELMGLSASMGGLGGKGGSMADLIARVNILGHEFHVMSTNLQKVASTTNQFKAQSMYVNMNMLSTGNTTAGHGSHHC